MHAGLLLFGPAAGAVFVFSTETIPAMDAECFRHGRFAGGTHRCGFSEESLDFWSG